LPLFLAAVAASAFVLAAPASAVVPPSGTPDLAAMALGVQDFAPGAKVARQLYVRPDDPFVAAYDRGFKELTTRLGTKKLISVESEIELARTAADAKDAFDLAEGGIARVDPSDFAAAFAKRAGFKPKYVKLGRPFRVRVRDAAAAVVIRIGTPVGEIQTLIAFVREARVFGLIVTAGYPGVPVGRSVAGALARKMSAHIRDNLVPVETTPPAIAGTAALGQTLTASPGTWRNDPTQFGYRWQRCDSTGAACQDIAGATASSYVVTDADVGSTLRVTVTATNALGSATASSPVTAVIVPAAPAGTAAPSVSGTASVGQTLTAEPGSWTGAPTLAYQWQRCDQTGANCVDIAGATAQTYVVADADRGSTVRVAVTATNAAGSATAFSAPTPVVT
jgi:hypothetical protein